MNIFVKVSAGGIYTSTSKLLFLFIKLDEVTSLFIYPTERSSLSFNRNTSVSAIRPATQSHQRRVYSLTRSRSHRRVDEGPRSEEIKEMKRMAYS